MTSATPDTQHSANTDDIAARIEASHLSDGMKANMRLVHAHLQGVQWGMPQYDLKGTQIWASMSNFAFFFSVLYYLVKGLWRKALVLLAIGFAINILVASVSVWMDIKLPFPLNNLGTLLVSGIAMLSAYSDIYRHTILGQKFWW